MISRKWWMIAAATRTRRLPCFQFSKTFLIFRPIDQHLQLLVQRLRRRLGIAAIGVHMQWTFCHWIVQQQDAGHNIIRLHRARNCAVRNKMLWWALPNWKEKTKSIIYCCQLYREEGNEIAMAKSIVCANGKLETPALCACACVCRPIRADSHIQKPKVQVQCRELVLRTPNKRQTEFQNWKKQINRTSYSGINYNARKKIYILLCLVIFVCK